MNSCSDYRNFVKKEMKPHEDSELLGYVTIKEMIYFERIEPKKSRI